MNRREKQAKKKKKRRLAALRYQERMLAAAVEEEDEGTDDTTDEEGSSPSSPSTIEAPSPVVVPPPEAPAPIVAHGERDSHRVESASLEAAASAQATVFVEPPAPTAEEKQRAAQLKLIRRAGALWNGGSKRALRAFVEKSPRIVIWAGGTEEDFLEILKLRRPLTILFEASVSIPASCDLSGITILDAIVTP